MATQNEKALARAQFFDAGIGSPDTDTVTLEDIKKRNPFTKAHFSHVLQVGIRILFGEAAFRELKDLTDPKKTIIVPHGGRSKGIPGSRILIQKRKSTI